MNIKPKVIKAVFYFLNPKQNGFDAATQTKKENKYLSL